MKKEEKTELTKSRILEAAMSEFGTRGYAAGSVNHICKTGINKGLVYHNFKDKDELYLICVKKSCDDLLDYVIRQKADDSFIKYMSMRKRFFQENEQEAYLFLEARTNPPRHLADRIRELFVKVDELNMEVCEKELSRYELRTGVSKEDALHYFSGIQKLYNLSFMDWSDTQMSAREKLDLHEMNIHKMFDLMLYGIAKGGNEK